MNQNFNFKWLVKNSIYGLVYGVIFVLINLSTGFSIAIPIISLSLGNTIRWIVVVGLAPLLEELFFLIVLVLLYYIFKKNLFFSIGATGLLFGVYHLVAYNAQTGAMISAMVFRVIVCLVYLLRKSNIANPLDYRTTSTLISVIIMHGVFNAYILNKSVGLVVAG